MANLFCKVFGLVFQCSGPPPPTQKKKWRPKFTPKLVGIPLQFHFLEPKMFSRRFSAYGGDQQINTGVANFRRMSETPTTTTSQKSIAIHLQFVLQYMPPICIAVLLVPLRSEEGKDCQYYSHLYRSTPPVSQYSSLYRSAPPICIAVLLGKSWCLVTGIQVGMNGDTSSINAPKECSKKFVATFQGKFLTRRNVLRVFSRGIKRDKLKGTRLELTDSDSTFPKGPKSQTRTGAWKCPRSLPADPSPSIDNILFPWVQDFYPVPCYPKGP